MLSIDFSKDSLEIAEKKLLALNQDWSNGYANFLKDYRNNKALIIESSGSTGLAKKHSFTSQQYLASAKKSINYFLFKQGQNAFLALPYNTVGGQLMLLRASIAKMKITLAKPSLDAYAKVHDVVHFAPMVYSQLQYLIDKHPNALKHYKNILLGGAPLPDAFIKNCTKYPTQFYASYGMTETLSHIAIKNLSAGDKYYTLLPGNTASINTDDCIEIECDYLEHKLRTTDMGIVDGNKLEIIGRKDFIIISSGKKINPESIENQLNEFLKHSFIIAPHPHPQFGEVLALLSERAPNLEEKKAIENYNSKVDNHLKIREYFVGKIFSTEQKILRQKTLDNFLTKH